MPARPGARGQRRVSLRALAGHLHVSHTAVQKAVGTGRLRKSVRHDDSGRPYVSDLKLAAKEWAVGASKAPNTGGSRAGNGKAHHSGAGSLLEAQVRLATQRARGLELANRFKQGELLEASTVQRESFEAARTIRDSILNVPDRVAAELAAETDEGRVHARLKLELQRALRALAEILDRG